MILSTLKSAFKKAYEKLGINIEPKIIISNKDNLCDYQCDDAFKLAKELKTNPLALGTKIIEALKVDDNFDQLFLSVEAVAPGFVNIKLSNSLINKALNELNCEHFGLNTNSDDTYFFDYGGPNVAKPLHVGHSRSPIIGEAIKRMYQYIGYKTISDIHLGDSGLQFGEVMFAINRDGLATDDITLAYLDKAYPEMSALCKEDPELKKKCEDLAYEIQQGESKYMPFYEKICSVSIKEIKRIYDYLDITFDTWEGEFSSLKYINKVEQKLKDKNLLMLSEGLTVVDVSTPTDNRPMPPLIFKKSNGASMYSTTELATIQQRLDKFNPQHFIYLADNRQSLHFEQVFRTVKLSDLSQASFEFCGFGTVNGTDGKPYKTRAGDTPKLWDLLTTIKERFIALRSENINMPENDLDKIVAGILKFADLQNFREKDYIFDIDKFSKVVGKTGPYIMYSYVRTNKVLNETPVSFNEDISNNSDRQLRLKILQLPNIYSLALSNNAPDIIANYVYNLCVASNGFYENNRIADAPQEQKLQWISLLSMSNKIIKDMSYILGLQMPSKM